MRMRHLALVVAIATGPAMALDHLDPVALNAAAIEALRADDLRTAQILLARAARLAPNDARIARTRGVLEAKRAGESPTLEAVPLRPAESTRKETPAPATAIPPAPPPLWPPK